MEKKFLGYRRENGRVGVRNHVVILPLDDLSNAACEAVANNVKGALALPHAYGRLQFGEDLELHFRTLIGIGCNRVTSPAARMGSDRVAFLGMSSPKTMEKALAMIRAMTTAAPVATDWAIQALMSRIRSRAMASCMV